MLFLQNLPQFLFVFLIQAFTCLSSHENDIVAFLKDHKLDKILGTGNGETPDFELVTPIRQDKLGLKSTRNIDDYPDKEFYSLIGLGQTFNLQLKKNLQVLDKNMKLFIHEEDGTINKLNIDQSAPCLYEGQSSSHPGSMVALSTCNGKLMGIIKTNIGNYIIQKLPDHLIKRSDDSNYEQDHIIYKAKPSRKNCPVKKRGFPANYDFHTRPSSKTIRNAAEEADELTVELAVFADVYLYKLFTKYYKNDPEKELLKYITCVIHAAHIFYSTVMEKKKFNLVIIRVDIIKTTKTRFNITSHADRYLDSFCLWQGKINIRSDANPDHWDHACMFTGLNLQVDGETGVIGIAPLEGMCSREMSCSLSEMDNFAGMPTFVHEMGHNVGMEHDGEGNSCNEHQYIMAPAEEQGQTTWSKCSQQYLKSFLRSNPSCLCDKRTNGIPLGTKMPGEVYDVNQQCKILMKPGGRHYEQQPLSEICHSLQCTDGKYVKSRNAALEGTDCGDGKKCKSGKCVGSVEQNVNVQSSEPNHYEDYYFEE